jgi:4-amino-4-deoxy-L-arabinose transferase-like glycosyltransferase
MNAISPVQIRRFGRTHWRSISLLVLAAYLCLWNLTIYPLPWFDEGINFQAPKNLIMYGQYAMRSSEEFRVLDPAFQTGLPVELPITLSFKLFGIGLFQARLVSAMLSLLCVAIYYVIARQLYSRAVGWLAVILLLAFAPDSFVSFLYVGRQALGETSALLFFLGGLLLWFQSWERLEHRYLVGAGLLCGLAMITKSQFNLLVPPTILTVWLIGFFWLKLLRWRHLIVPAVICVGMVFAWYLCQIIIAGPHQFLLNAVVLREGMQIHVLELFSPAKVRTALGVLARTGYPVWGGLGLIYALWRIRRPMPASAKLRQLALIVFTGIWLVWYVFASIGWSRYAFIAEATTHIFYAVLLYDVFVALLPLKQINLKRQGWQLASAFALVLITGWMLASGYSTIRQIIWSDNKSYFEFAAYLDQNVPPNAVVESWEWELDLITDLRYHHPTTEVTNAITYELWVAYSPVTLDYDPRQFAPDYLVVGPFARWTQLYTRTGLLKTADLQKTIGEYELYRVTH